MKILFQSRNRVSHGIALAAAGYVMAITAATSEARDPRTNGWFTSYAGQYARIYTNSAMQAAGAPRTTWSNGSQTQSLPAYCGVQEVYSSSNWIYVRSTGLASYDMGPWFMNAAHTTEFPNLPVNQKVLFRFPRLGAAAATSTVNGGGQIGVFVDGVAMFNSWDAYTWDPATSSDTQNYTGFWNRDAYVNEGVTFDPGYAHQQNTGVYHYHADPIALRYLLGDHVDYNATARTYSESTNPPTQHSPILAWTADGFPLYGPYGYVNATNPASGIRRLVSGYVPRNGLNGSDNLATNGALRTTIPVWAQIFYQTNASQSGPAVSTSYPFGRYMEDNAYLGDLTNTASGTNYQQGIDFDLDRFNGRWCVTPDFTNGTYAYFVAINSDGAPVFPYNIGRAYYGNPTGGGVSSIAESVTTNFLGYTNLTTELNVPAVSHGAVTLTWSALEGGVYAVQATTNLAGAAWALAATNLSPVEISGGYTDAAPSATGFYRVARTSVASYDSAGTTVFNDGGYGIISVSPASETAGTTFTLTVTLDGSVNLPPASAPINKISVGAITGTSDAHVSQTEVTSSITLPAGATTGQQTVTVVFPGPPADPSNVVTYTLTNGFTIAP
jgi:hypothetical protein